MVQAVNHVFEGAADPVFVTGAAAESIAFLPVDAQGRAEQWRVNGAPGPALVAHWLAQDVADKPLTVGRYRDRAADACAARVAHLLALGQRGSAGFAAAGDWTPVRPADIAILVGTSGEADLVRAALGRVGVRSVYLSERESVYQSPLALELAVCLEACAQPEDERVVRAALATPLLARSAGELRDLVEDERAWDAQVERFQGYHRCWRERGVLPAVRRLLHDFDVPARLLGLGPGGERQLTDCLHLAELLQQASSHLDGEQALLRFLRRQRESSTDEGALHLRLESDEGLVRVVTIHKSKGLEYPLVFLPFVCASSKMTKATKPVRLMRDGHPVWVVEPTEADTAWMARERLGEEVRKFYVALTRARHAVWITLANVSADPTGIGHVLPGDLASAWEKLVECPGGVIAWDEDTPDADLESLGTPAAPLLGPARRLVRPVVTQPWWIASYSALHRLGESEGSGRPAAASEPESAVEDILRETRVPFADWLPAAGEENAAACASLLRDFPRGSEAGTFLHGLLEWAGQRGFRNLGEARDLIARRCQVRVWEAHIDRLHQWLLDFVATDWRPDLPERPVLRFDALPACLPEMEFWLPVSDVGVERLDRLITQRTFGGRARPALAAAHLNGMFKGFIDLTLRAGDRYYLIDYKSNDLGPRDSDYDGEALVDALCAARYDVQMLMYVLALHRQLRARLPDYDYDRDMGGAVYLFLRGQAARGQGLLALRPPRALVEALDALFRGREEGSHG
jgi:exodeoxyribonuclease V beta subunit